MHDRLPPTGMYSGSRDLFRVWEIGYNISETVQKRHSFIYLYSFNEPWQNASLQ